jgi:hypothetical protein
MLLSKDNPTSGGRPSYIYCSKVIEDNPSSRLAIFVGRTLADGEPFYSRLRSNGQNNVFKTNTCVVDLLEGGIMNMLTVSENGWF